MTTAVLPPRRARVSEPTPVPGSLRPWKISRLRGRTVAALTAAVLVMPSLFWVCLDHSVWTWDQSWYAEVSTELYYTLIHDPRHWIQAVLVALGTKAPGIT